MQQRGLRAFVGKVSMDTFAPAFYSEHTPAQALAAARGFLDAFEVRFRDVPAHRRVVQPVVTPRFVPTCSDALLEGLGALAEERNDNDDNDDNNDGNDNDDNDDDDDDAHARDMAVLRIQSHMAESHDVVEYVPRHRGARSDVEIFDKVIAYSFPLCDNETWNNNNNNK